MAIAKVLGIETEYGIAGGPDHDPITASSIVVNAYAQQGRTRINWDFEDETPDLDARGLPGLTSFAPIVETHLANTVLTNGARLYVDHAHPEYSSPECRTPLEAVALRRGGRVGPAPALARRQRVARPGPGDHPLQEQLRRQGQLLRLPRELPRDARGRVRDVVRAMVPHFVSRQIVVGAGKVGAETEDGLEAAPAFQLSQRAEFFEEVVGLETTLKRPIINTRDEPHGDPERFRRLHVIVGDANMSRVATLVKLGSTALLLGVLEDRGPDVFPAAPRHPVSAIRAYALDPSGATVAVRRRRRRAHGLGPPGPALDAVRAPRRRVRGRRRGPGGRGGGDPGPLARDARRGPRRPRRGRRPGGVGGEAAPG